MVEEFLNKEILEQGYRCGRCEKVRKCVRKFDIHRLPQILIVHLKRFCFGRWKREKINAKVRFGTSLDIQGNRFDLYGVVHHYGDLNFGHYTA